MKTFQEFMNLCEAYDKEVMSGSQIKTMGAGGRLSPERRKTAPERKRMKSVTDPKTGKVTRVPVEPKARKDVGAQKGSKTQAPTQERGSADVKAKAAAAAKEERKKAALARIAAKKKGEAAPAAKPKAQELAKTASKLLAKKAAPKPKAPPKDERFSSSRDPEDTMIKGSLLPKGEKRPYTRQEKVKIKRTAKRLQADLQKGREKPASHYSLK